MMSLDGGDKMKTVTLQVATRQDVNRRVLEAFRGKKQGSRMSFATPELLFRLMTAKRWALIRTITGAGPLTIREIARRIHRDVKAVHGFNIAMDSACNFPNGQWPCSSDGADQRPTLGCHKTKQKLWCCKAHARAL